MGPSYTRTVTRKNDDGPEERARRRLVAARLTSQMLGGAPARDPVDVVERILAVQGQDPVGVRLAVRARSRGLTAALTAPPLLAGINRRLAQEGVSPAQAERGVRAVVRALEREGALTRALALTRARLAERIAAADVPTAGQALVHVLALAGVRGLIVRGPMHGKDQAYVLTAEWLGAAPAFDRDRAVAELARRYLAGHGPAGDRDLAKWAGPPLRDARAGLRAIGGGLAERTDGLVDLAARPRPRPLPRPKLLGALTPCCTAGRRVSRCWARRRASSR